MTMINSNPYKYLKLSRTFNEKILVVKLNRPSKLNSINSKMWREIGHLFTNVDSDARYSSVRCIILSGAGRAFCAGIDIFDGKFNLMSNAATTEVDTARKFLAAKGMISNMQACFSALERSRIPVVAAVNGMCIGAGVDLICAADIRICTSNALFSVKEVRLGLAADVGTLQRLPKIVGFSSIVRDICFTGRNFDATEAMNIGFVSKVLPDEDKLYESVLNLCRSIVSNSPVAVASTKMALNFSRDHSVNEGLDYIATHNSAALMTDDLLVSALSLTSKSRRENDKRKADEVGVSYKDLVPNSKL